MERIRVLTGLVGIGCILYWAGIASAGVGVDVINGDKQGGPGVGCYRLEKPTVSAGVNLTDGDKAEADDAISKLDWVHQPREAFNEALNKLIALGEKAVPQLLDAYKNNPDPYIRAGAAVALGIIGNKRAIEAFGNALDEDSENYENNDMVRSQTVQELRRIAGNESTPPKTKLRIMKIIARTLFKDDNKMVRTQAALVFYNNEYIGFPKEKVQKILRKALAKEKDEGVRIWISGALAKIGDKKDI